MLNLKAAHILAPGIGHVVEERPAPLRDLIGCGTALKAVPTEQESRRAILRVLARAARDNGFIAELTHRGSKALEGYTLTKQAMAALVSGDVCWIEARVGKLDPGLRTWLDCRLQQEIW